MASSSTEEAQAIMLCLDNSWWMESIDSPMFQDQLNAVSLYCEKKFKHPDTLVGVVGMAGLYERSIDIYPTKSLQTIITALNYANIMRIGGDLQLVNTARFALFRLDPFFMGFNNLHKRIVLFAGGDVCWSPGTMQLLGEDMKEMNVACDVISFGDPYNGKRDFFDTLISFADNNGNCNVCHVPPESSVRDALSRSRIFNPHVGGRSRSAQSSSLQYHVKKKAIDIYLKPPSDGADLNTDCPFCQTVLLTLMEKGVPYNPHFIDLLNKPKGIPKQKRHETLPLIKFRDGTWVSNSDVIVGMIDKKYPGRSLVTPPQFAYLGLKILPKLAAFLKTKDDNDGSKQALLYELKELDKHLSECGPCVNGKEITAVDLSLAPKLYHLENVCSFYKNWNILQDFPNVESYKKFLFGLDSFKTTKPCKQNVIKGWVPLFST